TAAGAHHAPRYIADRIGGFVERHAWQRHATVAHRAQHQARIERLVLAGALGPQPAVLIEHQHIALDAHARHAAILAQHLHWRDEEAHRDGALTLPIGAARKRAQDLDVAL